MAFQFSLETVLWLRQVAEEREERALEELFRRMAQQRARQVELRRERQRLCAACESLLRVKAAAAEYVLLQGQIGAVQGAEAECEAQLAKLEEEVEAQRACYRAAHQSRELLSRMRAEQMDVFRLEQLRKEQRQMDDVFSSRRTAAER